MDKCTHIYAITHYILILNSDENTDGWQRSLRSSAPRAPQIRWANRIAGGWKGNPMGMSL